MDSISSPRAREAAHTTDPRLAPGALLPSVDLPSVPGGEPVALRGGRGPRVLVVVHSTGCAACEEYVRGLAASTDALAEWGGRLMVVVPGPVEQAAELQEMASAACQVLADPEGRLSAGGAAVVIADEWGEIYFAADAGAEHGFPTLEEIAEWVRFIAIQCPECEGPEGEWRTI